jgi:hypothetical protein
MKLFNKDGNGAQEIVAAVGLISSTITFDKWEPLLPLGIRDVIAIIGSEPVETLAAFYDSDDAADTDNLLTKPLFYLQQAVAFFTWLKVIPTLDAQHDEAGRSRRLGENEKGLTALEQFKDEENILRLAYEATDMLIAALDAGKFDFWLTSRKYLLREGLLIRSLEDMNEYYNIGSHRLFVTLLPMLREIQLTEIKPIVGNYLAQMLAGDDKTADLCDTAKRCMALLTMKKAVERLPVEVLPEGIVQVQQSTPVKSRIKATQEAREAVASSLGTDAKRYLQQLQDLVDELNAEGNEVDYYISKPLVHSKGMSF